MSIPLERLTYAMLVLLMACAPETPTSGDLGTTEEQLYATLDEDLTQLKAEFNAMTNKVRLVFISGPSCGICLRGMDDLNQSIVASVQEDPRVHTFVLYVPTMGAEEKHAAAAIPLLLGPRVTHLWDPRGRSGLEFQEALGIQAYAWDVWMIYEPGARWDQDQPPPAPGYWEHQLGSLPKETLLEPSRFADAVNERLAAMPPATLEQRVAEVGNRHTEIMPVAQPRGYMIQQNHISRGGYQELKTIASIRYEGETEIDGRRYAVMIETARPHHYARTVIDGDRRSTIVWNGAEAVREGPSFGMPGSIQDELLASYDFDGWMTEWKNKDHQVRRLGMKKYGERLPWLMEAKLANGRTWHIYVDSHTGDAFRQALLGTDGQETLAVEFEDYRDVDGFRLPHEVRYLDGDHTLARDRFGIIYLETTPSATASADEQVEESG